MLTKLYVLIFFVNKVRVVVHIGQFRFPFGMFSGYCARKFSTYLMKFSSAFVFGILQDISSPILPDGVDLTPPPPPLIAYR